jgi:hypothetical protein
MPVSATLTASRRDTVRGENMDTNSCLGDVYLRLYPRHIEPFACCLMGGMF